MRNEIGLRNGYLQCFGYKSILTHMHFNKHRSLLQNFIKLWDSKNMVMYVCRYVVQYFNNAKWTKGIFTYTLQKLSETNY